MWLVAAPVFLTGLLVVGACGVDATREGDEVEPVPASAKTSDVADVPDRSAQEKIIAFGDSLTAGFGIGQDEAYPAALQVLIDEKGYPYEVINAGVSGETSAGGVRRLDWVLDDRDVAVLILELGANDGLRGLPPKEMAKNLNIIIDAAESRDIPVLLAGLSTDADNASRFLREFMEAYEKVAAERGVTFMPHFLDNVAGVEELNQSDGSHPNAAGARIVADNVWEFLEPMLNTFNAANP
jgi:acyl-CoA thioesterase-1